MSITYIMFRNDGERDEVTAGERWYFLLDQENYRIKVLIKADDCGEGSHRARRYMDDNHIAWRRFGEKRRNDQAALENWRPLHHRSTLYSKRADELFTTLDRGFAEKLPRTIFDALIDKHTEVVDLTML